MREERRARDVTSVDSKLRVRLGGQQKALLMRPGTSFAFQVLCCLLRCQASGDRGLAGSKEQQGPDGGRLVQAHGRMQGIALAIRSTSNFAG